MGPIEAANAAGAGRTQLPRTAVVPQILPSYTSFVLFNFELNLRASAVLGLVGAGGIGARIEFFRGRGDWEKLWGLVVMFFLVVFIVERISVTTFHWVHISTWNKTIITRIGKEGNNPWYSIPQVIDKALLVFLVFYFLVASCWDFDDDINAKFAFGR